MSLETPTWPKITDALGTTTNEFGALDWANLISDYYNGVNLGLLDASKIPIIGTLTRYKHEKLGLFDIDQSHYIIFSADDIDMGANRKIKFRRMNAPFEEDHAVLEGMPQTLLNKTVDFDLNTGSNIGTTAIKDNAITQAKMADNSVGTAEIIDGSVNSAKITDDSIMNVDINSNAGITDGKLAQITDKNKLPSSIAYEDEANIFTQKQTFNVQSGDFNSMEIYRPVNTSDSALIYFYLQDSLSNKTEYARIGTRSLNVTNGAEIGSVWFEAMLNGTMSYMARISENKFYLGSGNNLILNTTGLSPATEFTFPNENFQTVLGHTAKQVVENKTIDMAKNLPSRFYKTGWYNCTSNEIDAGGTLKNLTGVGDAFALEIGVGGKRHAWKTKSGTVGDMAGVYLIETWQAIRWYDPLLRVHLLNKPNTGNNRRHFVGWGPAAIVSNSDTEPLTINQSGFIFGYGAADTNYHIFHNDGAGLACVKVDTTIPIHTTDTNLILEIKAENGNSGFRWTLWDVIVSGSGNVGSKNTQLGTGLINTRVPGQSTLLYFQNIVYSGNTAIQSNPIIGVEVYSL